LEVATFVRVVRAAETTEQLIWVGWVGLVATGIPLIVIKGEIDQLMVLKLFCVGLAGANGLVLHTLLKRVERLEHADSVPTPLVFRLMLSLMLSQVAWWGAFTIGFLHRHVWDLIEWPPRPLLVIAAFVILIAALWAAGEAFLRKRPSRVKVEASDNAVHEVRGPGPTIDPLGKEE